MNTQDKQWQPIVTNLMKMSTKSIPGWLDGQIHGVGEIKAGKVWEISECEPKRGYLSQQSALQQNKVNV